MAPPNVVLQAVNWMEKDYNDKTSSHLEEVFERGNHLKTYKLAKRYLNEELVNSSQYKKAKALLPKLSMHGEKISQKLLKKKHVKVKKLYKFIKAWGDDNPCTKAARDVFNKEGEKRGKALLQKEPQRKALKKYLRYWGNFPCSAPVKDVFNKLGVAYLKTLKPTRSKQLAFVKYWKGYPCTHQVIQKLTPIAEKKFNALKTKNKNLNQWFKFCKKWRDFPIHAKAKKEFSLLANQELNKLQENKNKFSRKYRLKIFIKKYPKTVEAERAKAMLENL